MKIKNNENGFSAVEGLLIVILVGLIGFVGWYVWKNQTDKNVKTDSSSNNIVNTKKTTPKKQTDNKTYFEIKEFGVKFELPQSLKDLYYEIGNNGRTAYFSLTELKDTDCAADKTSQIALTRYTDADYEEDIQAAASKDSAKKLGQYYFSTASGQAACGDEGSESQNKASAMKAEIVKILPSTVVSTQ